MILEILYIFGLFVVSVGLLPLMFLAFRNFTRSRRAVIVGLARLEKDQLLPLDWQPKEYVGYLDMLFPYQYGWQSTALLLQQQNNVLQRILLHGLPKTAEIPANIKSSTRKYRLYFCFFVAPVTVLVLLPAYIRLGHSIAGSTGVSSGVWYLLFGVIFGFSIFLPTEKIRRWPEVERQT